MPPSLTGFNCHGSAWSMRSGTSLLMSGMLNRGPRFGITTGGTGPLAPEPGSTVRENASALRRSPDLCVRLALFAPDRPHALRRGLQRRCSAFSVVRLSLTTPRATSRGGHRARTVPHGSFANGPAPLTTQNRGPSYSFGCRRQPPPGCARRRSRQVIDRSFQKGQRTRGAECVLSALGIPTSHNQR